MRRHRPRLHRRQGRSGVALYWAAGALWASSAVLAGVDAGPIRGGLVLGLGLLSMAAWSITWRAWVQKSWAEPVHGLARSLTAFNDRPGESWDLPTSPTLTELIPPIQVLQRQFLLARDQAERAGDDSNGMGDSGEMSTFSPIDARMTRSGTYEPPTIEYGGMATGEYSTLDMINRLEPRTLRWLDSSQSEQDFLGYPLASLREKSFLDVVQPDDRELARQQLRSAVARGEAHGLVYRISTAKGETRAVELNVGVRYGPDRRVVHLRCHLTDITAKLRDETELRRRTQELIHANDQLRRTNRELEKLKDRYGDLYQNAPAMYFAVDRHGRFLECNDTLVRTLGHPRESLIGAYSVRLLTEGRRPSASDRFDDLPKSGPFEFESEWAAADGGSIYVWITGNAIASPEGKVRQYRCVATDITARRTLEAELRVKNDRLAAANLELSAKNKELDEFTYVVSHDLQEPLRTLIAFSDFLMRDQGDKLDETGREYVRYLVEASRRLRALIQDLLSLSRAGKVTAEFAVVDLNEVIETIRADFAELVRSRGAEIRVNAPLPRVWGDRDRIGQLLANLIGNGLKYNQSPDPRVEVEAADDPSGPGLIVSIRDNGIGIDPRFHAKVFQLFRRLHTREEYEGTGAGLAICQKIAQAHGGRIWLESEAGHGATFRVTLPKVPPETPEAAHAPA